MERKEVLVLTLTEKERWLKGSLDNLGNLTIGRTTYIAGEEGKVDTIQDESGNKIKISILAENKVSSVISPTIIQELKNQGQVLRTTQSLIDRAVDFFFVSQ